MEEYNLPTTLSRKEEILQGELTRIRSTASFKFGNHFVKALERPWRILLLPITLPLLMWKLFREDKNLKVDTNKKTRNCVVMFSTSSSRGLHFDRCEALISHFNDSELQIVHITTEGLGVRNSRKDIQYYIFPERTNIVGMNPKLWNTKCEVFLNNILDIFSPKTFIFDGDYPFRGMLNAMESREEMNRYWIRESSQNFKTSSLPVDGFELFDAIIHPTLSRTPDSDRNIGRSGSIYCNPILTRPPSESEREMYRLKHISKGCQLIFLDVGKRDELAENIASHLLLREDVYLLVRRNMCIRTVLDHPRTIIASDLNYSQAIGVSDAVVLYPDHFSLHAAFHSERPTLSVFDDAKTIENLNEEFDTEDLPSLYLDSTTNDNLVLTAIDRLLDLTVQEQLKQRMSEFNIDYDTQNLVDLIITQHS
ncbi:hypothetical protein N9N14_03745 [Candidatus Poseidonia alphae]|nr:hypothetical protein [Candidatus Poseidonia alphae]